MIRNVFMVPVVEEMLQRVRTRVVDCLPHFRYILLYGVNIQGYASTQLGLAAAVRSDKIAARMDTAGSRRVDE